jgi:hypothetical protein
VVAVSLALKMDLSIKHEQVPNKSTLNRKFRKLVRDPGAFFKDAIRKRVGS